MRSAQVVLVLAPLLALAQDDVATVTPASTATATSTDLGYTSDLGGEESTIGASDYLSAIYGTATPAGATGAAATSLASALDSYESQLYTDAGYLSAANDVYYAIASQTDADAIFSTLDAGGVLNGGYTTASWYVNGVPESAKREMSSIISGFHSVQTSVLGAVATTTASTGGSSATGASAGSTITSAASNTASATGSAVSASASTAGAAGPKITNNAVAGLAAVVAVGAAVLY
ncbi:hypothetical protein SCUP515_08184 [Seiridium cupressi]